LSTAAKPHMVGPSLAEHRTTKQDNRPSNAPAPTASIPPRASAVRTGKSRYDLLAAIAIRREAELLERGAIKYGERNWENGIPISSFIGSALRHLFNYLAGETTEDHLAAARWNLGCAMHFEETRPELQDIPNRLQKG